jgi:hypothetical protein
VTTYIHVGDIGTIIELDITDTDGVAINVSSATVKYIYLKKPSGTKIKRDAEFTNTGSDGKIQYTTISGDIDRAGEWQVEGYVELTDGKFFTTKDDFVVLPTLYVAS